MLFQDVLVLSILISGGIDRFSNLFMQCSLHLFAFLAVCALFGDSYVCFERSKDMLLYAEWEDVAE